MEDIAPQETPVSPEKRALPTIDFKDMAKTIQDTMDNLDVTTATTQEIRKQLLARFLPDVLNLDMKVDPGTDPDLYASQARFLSEFKGLLNDVDTASRQHASTKLKQKDTETQAQAGFNVAEFLSKIKLTGGVPTSSGTIETTAEIDEKLEQRFAETGCVVLDTELTQGENMLPEKNTDADF